MSDISLAAVNRIVKRIDPNIRIGVQSKEELRNSLEEYGVTIGEIATSLAKNANRNTILPQDIVTAREQLMLGVTFHKNQTTA